MLSFVVNRYKSKENFCRLLGVLSVWNDFNTLNAYNNFFDAFSSRSGC